MFAESSAFIFEFLGPGGFAGFLLLGVVLLRGGQIVRGLLESLVELLDLLCAFLQLAFKVGYCLSGGFELFLCLFRFEVLFKLAVVMQLSSRI